MLITRLIALCLVLIGAVPAAAGAPTPGDRSSSGTDLAWSMVIRSQDRDYAAFYDDARRLIQYPPTSLRGETDLACVAVAIYHEARNQSTFGQLAVGSVIQERARNPSRWGHRPCDVVIPVQFSFMTSRYGFPAITEKDAWIVAVNLAIKSLVEGPLPQLRRADHYHTEGVTPTWDREMILIGRIDDHLFYRDPDSQM